MGAADVRQIVARELAGCSDLRNWHGITVQNCHEFLVEPFTDTFTTPDDGCVTLWVVLDEMPGYPEHGYLVVFDPTAQQFGLALKPHQGNPGVFLGYSGTFLQTMAGM